jgi:putative FmdB family regulatory protein
MPIYEYTCAKCGKTIEVIQRFSDKDLRKHEKCGGNLTKLISASSFHLKGTGWYKTDYAAKADKSDGKEGSDAGKKETADQKTEPAAEKSTSKSDSATTTETSSSKTEKTPKSGASKS